MPAIGRGGRNTWAWAATEALQQGKGAKHAYQRRGVGDGVKRWPPVTDRIYVCNRLEERGYQKTCINRLVSYKLPLNLPLLCSPFSPSSPLLLASI